MREMNNLQKALLMAMETELNQYEKLAESEPEHTFSPRYLKRRKEIIRMADRQKTVLRNDVYRYSTARRVSFRTILVAALIMIFATVSVIAIAKPHIYYVIKERVDSWKISFFREDAMDDQDPNNMVFELHRPEIPDGFMIEFEDGIDGPDYFLLIRDADGMRISFNQDYPDSVTVYMDSEGADITKEIVDGHEVITHRYDGVLTDVICNDGDYVYSIYADPGIDESIVWQMMESILND